MKVTIVSPERTLYAGEATAVHLPGVKGNFEALDRHAPIITILAAGQVSVDGSTPMSIAVNGGFAEISRNEATVCIETGDAPKEKDE